MLSFGSNGVSNAYSGMLSGAGSLTKLGGGVETLSASNTFTGSTLVSGGSLILQNGAFRSTARNYTIASGAVLSLQNLGGGDNDTNNIPSGTTTFSGSGTLQIASGWISSGNGPKITMQMGAGGLISIAAGAGIVNGGWQDITWTNNQASLTVSGTYDLWDGNTTYVDALNGTGFIIDSNGGGKTLQIGVANGSGTFSGAVPGNAALTKAGTGIEVLAGTNSYTGGTTISGGTLQFGGNAATPASQTLSGLISGAGQLVWAGSGVMNLTDASNSLTGNLAITAGTLAATGGGGGSTSAVGQSADGRQAGHRRQQRRAQHPGRQRSWRRQHHVYLVDLHCARRPGRRQPRHQQ